MINATFANSAVTDVSLNIIYNFRKTWKSFEGFPRKNAALAYVYVVTQLLSGKALSQRDESNDNEDGKKSTSDEHNGMGAIVSTLL